MDFFTTEVLTLKGLLTYYVLFFIQDSPSEPGRIHAIPGSGVDGATGTKHDYGGVGMPERLPLSAARPRYEVLRVLSGGDRIGKRGSASLAGKKPEFELVCRTLGEISQRGMPSKAHPGWRVIAARALQQYLLHYHEERNHQGKGNRILFPLQARRDTGAVRCRERLGGLLKYYEREAA
jgi:hypothetical protein